MRQAMMQRGKRDRDREPRIVHSLNFNFIQDAFTHCIAIRRDGEPSPLMKKTKKKKTN